MSGAAPMPHDAGGWAGVSPGIPGLGHPPGPPEAASWGWRPEILLPLSVLLALFGLGWWRLRRHARPPAATWRLCAYFTGIAAVGLALLSPLARLADDLFFVHMIQHLLLIKIAAPALLLADPLPEILWSLPGPARLRAGRLLAPGAPLRAAWRAVTRMPLTWLTYALTLWLWHLPVAYDAALSDRLLHDAEHLMFFGAGLLFWWPLISPAPHLRGPVHHAVRIVYLLLAAFHEAVLGLLLTLAPWVLYSSYALVPRVQGVSAQDDQTWGGIIMWGAGGAIDMLAVLWLLFRMLGKQERLSPSGPAIISPPSHSVSPQKG